MAGERQAGKIVGRIHEIDDGVGHRDDEEKEKGATIRGTGYKREQRIGGKMQREIGEGEREGISRREEGKEY